MKIKQIEEAIREMILGENYMKYKILLFLIIAITLINLVLATNIYAGESINITLPEEYNYYSIVGNSTEIFINVSQEGNIVTITLDKYSSDDSFEIIFFNQEKEIIEHYSSGGGGGTRTIVKNKTIEVPNYITIYETNETIKEIPIEIETQDKSRYSDYIIGGLITLAFLGLFGLIYLILTKRKHRVERRLKNEKTI